MSDLKISTKGRSVFSAYIFWLGAEDTITMLFLNKENMIQSMVWGHIYSSLYNTDNLPQPKKWEIFAHCALIRFFCLCWVPSLSCVVPNIPLCHLLISLFHKARTFQAQTFQQPSLGSI